MNFVNNLLEQLMEMIPKKHRKLATNDNLIALTCFATAMFIYNKNPKALVGLLVHPFSQVILLGTTAYLMSNKKYTIAVGVVFIFMTTILVNKENDIVNLLPIENREFFKDKNSTKEEFEEKEDGDNDEEEEEEDEDFEDDDSSNEEDFEDEDSDDSDDDEDDTEEFTPDKNLNDTFKNLHDAIHQLETFVTTPN